MSLDSFFGAHDASRLIFDALLKYYHWREDVEGDRLELRYLRDTDGREVDFVVLRNHAPEFAVECKTGEKSVSPAARYFAERTRIPVFYQVHRGKNHFQSGRVTVVPFSRWCRDMAMP